MDRVNRSLLIASTLLAIPAALLMTPLSHGKSPEVQVAVGQQVEQNRVIRQVAGQQPSDRQTRPGLLQVLAGAASKGSENHQHQNMSKAPSTGLLNTLFSRSPAGNHSTSKHSSHAQHSRAQKTHAQHTQSQHSHAAATSPHSQPAASAQPDWSGVPYHQAAPSEQASNPVPLRDPGHPSLLAEQSDTRIIRGGTSRTFQAIPASSRRPSEPTVARKSSLLSVPTPPHEEEIPSPSPIPLRDDLSSSTSSRRSGRRSLEPLSVPQSTSEIATIRQGDSDDSEVADLVPRVARKTVQSEPSKGSPAVAIPSGNPSGNPSGKAVQAEVAKAEQETKTAVAAIGLPQPTRAASEAEEPEATAKARGTLSATVPTRSKPAPLTAARSATLGTPASTVSHRSGPPSQAFGSDQIGDSGDDAGMAQSHLTPGNAVTSPVGSGVVPNGGVASSQHRSEPVYEIAENTTAASDPYGRVIDPSGPRMSTNGQTVPPPSNHAAPRAASAVPMQPIQGYASQEAYQTPGDNFSSSTADGRNQMREALPGNNPNPSASTSELPGIRVTTVGPAAIMIRQTIQYEIRVENRGAIEASGVLVRALIPDWAEIRGQNATRGDIDNQTQGSSDRLAWTIDHLPAGASETMYVRLMAARSGTYDLDVDWTMLPQKNTSKVQVREPRLDLTIEGPDEVVFGQSQTYKVRVLNPGDGTAPNVVFTLSPNSATPQTQKIGDIPPGKEAQFDVELTAQDLGDLKIHGLASGELELRAEAEKTIRVASAKLEIVLSGPEVKYQNTEAMYSLQIQNNGTATSERVVATLRLPTGAKYLGGLDDAVQQGSVLRWEINAMAPGANRDYQFHCNMASTGEHLFAFDCKGSAAGNASVSIATRVESIADLVLTISDPVAPAPIGTDVTYEIVIRNRGSKEAVDVRAIAQFSHGIEPQRIEGQSGEVMAGQVLFDPIPRIGPGQELRLKVIAQADLAGHHRFRAEVRSGDTVLVAEEATHYMSPKGDRVSRRSTDASTR